MFGSPALSVASGSSIKLFFKTDKLQLSLFPDYTEKLYAETLNQTEYEPCKCSVLLDMFAVGSMLWMPCLYVCMIAPYEGKQTGTKVFKTPSKTN